MYFVVIETKIIIKKNFSYISSHVVFQNSNIVKSRIYIGILQYYHFEKLHAKICFKSYENLFFSIFHQTRGFFWLRAYIRRKAFYGGRIFGWAYIRVSLRAGCNFIKKFS